MLTHFITYYLKITPTHVTTVVRKVFNYWKGVEIMIAKYITLSKIFPAIQILSFINKYCHLFS